MRFTIFGLTISSAWGNGHATPNRALFRALVRRRHSVTFYEKDVEYYAVRRDFTGRDFCDLRLYDSWDSVRDSALRAAAESDAVIVTSFCPEGARISDALLELAGPLRIFYDMDTPVTLRNFAAGSLDYLRRDQISEFELVLSFTGGRALRELRERWGARRVEPLYGCVDPDFHHRVPPRADFECDLSYMGTYDPGRQAKLDAFLLEPARRTSTQKFVLAGTFYPWSWSWPPNLRRFDHVAPQDHSALYSSSRCTLNITRAEMAANGYCPSGRFFEAAACGTPILTDSWPGLDEFFTPGEELIRVESAEDVQQTLARDDYDLARIAERARERTLDEHTGENRAQQFLSYLENAAGLESRPHELESAR